ncbi:MAG: hypothetical protein IJY46_06890 [Lentisphaeria bacterium]|nr:hypothetical protein [Lentisphaeria bacterium]
MKKIWLFAVAAILSGGGCVRTSTLEWSKPVPGAVSSSGTPVVWQLKARNCGVYLFNVVPIWSGKESRPNRKDYRIGQDRVNEWDMRRLLDSQLHKLGADRVEDIKMSSYSSGAWGLWIFWKKSMVATGLAVKNASKQKKR